MPDSGPRVIDVRQSRYGYWIVTISVQPGRRMDVMIAMLGITREEAAYHALETLPLTTNRKGVR